MRRLISLLLGVARATLAAQNGLRFLGRVNPATAELTWPGTGLTFNFFGSKATIHFDSIAGSNSVNLYIDSGEPDVITNVNSTSLSTPSGLSEGNHTVVLRKRSEALFGTIAAGTVTTDGDILPISLPNRQIEYIGDSITVGYGLDGVNPCTNNAAVEDNPRTYAALAADDLDADYHVIAWSGIGLIRNYVSTTPDDSPNMVQRYTKYGANDADNTYTFPSDWSPAAVVINLGTNDFGYAVTDSSGELVNAREPLDADAYKNAMVEFVRSIQGHYTEAQFFLLGSPMLSDFYPTAEDAQHTTQSSALQAAVEELGSNAHYVEWPTQGADVGCDYHPNAATHAEQAIVLGSTLRSIMNW